MQRHIIATAVIVLALLSGGVLSAEEASFAVRIDRYVGTTYVPPPAPSTMFIFLQGEPIWARIIVTNEGDGALPLFEKGGSNGASFRVRLVSAPPSSPEPHVSLSNQARVKEDAGDEPASWGTPLSLAAGARVETDVLLYDDRDDLPVGVYELQFQPMSLVGQRTIRAHSPNIRFEIRAATDLGGRLERLRRDGMRALSEKDLPEVEAIANKLLALHPDSWVAYWLKGTAATLTRNAAAAANNFEAAADRLERGVDVIYLRSGNARDGSRAAASLRALVGQQKQR